MNPETWAAVDRYFVDALITPTADAALHAALEASVAAGLPAINVAPNQGKLLHLLARMMGARRILEIGTLGGYSTIWLARALPAGGRLVTLELDRQHAEVARANFARAGVSDVIDLRVGPALEALPRLAAEAGDPFDFIFIDADKASVPEYVSWAIRLSRVGSVIVVDNVVRDGAVIDEASTNAGVLGIRRMFGQLAADRRVSATAIQTVGAKGYDGLAIVMVTENVDA